MLTRGDSKRLFEKKTLTMKTTTDSHTSGTRTLKARIHRLMAAFFLVSLPTLCAQPLHLLNGLELVEQILDVQHQGIFVDANQVEINRYGGSWNSANDPSYIQFQDLQQGILPGNNTTCSPFVTHLLKTTYNWSWYSHPFFDPIQNKIVKTSSPSSYRYVALIEQGVGFEAQIPTLDQVQPGDIMAIHYLGSTGGHTTLVANVDWASIKAYPSEHANADPSLAGTFYVEVNVIDSSNGHHTNDSRMVTVNGQTIETHGLGIGTMGVLIDSGFNALGYTWSLPTSDYETKKTGWLNGLHSRLHLQSERKMVFGRLQELP